jgi:hypothetical protein
MYIPDISIYIQHNSAAAGKYTIPEVEVEVIYDRRSVGQSVLVSGHHLGLAINSRFTCMEIIFRQLGDCYNRGPL